MRSTPLLLGALVAFGSGACDGDTALPVEADCNPLGATGCLTPWPSSSLGTNGFAAATPITMEVEAAIDPASLALPDATIVLDLTTSERVAHAATIEARPDGVQAIRILPASRLESGHRYAVAISDVVLDLDGDSLEATPGFEALLDENYTDHELLEAMRPRFADTLDSLESAGLDVDSLVVAWDFAAI